jgi:TolB protein
MTSFGFHRGNADLIRSNLYVMNADGSGKRKLTRTVWFGAPVWSPDGKKIAFQDRLDPRRWGGQCGQDCNVDVYVMNANGTGRRNLTRTAGYDADPVWSPDGQKIAYIGARGKGPMPWGKPDIHVMNADGSGQTRLTHNPQTDVHPVWSPDGRQIAFMSWHAPNWDIWVMNADGSGLRNLTRSPAQDVWPAWSPDGRTIAFTRTRNFAMQSADDNQLYVMNADGSGQRLLTRIVRPIGAPPEWSPDGRRLLLSVDDSPESEIFVVNADGSGRRRLADGGPPLWSPNGEQIAFVRNRDVYVMSADGSKQRNLSLDISEPAGSVAWMPAPRS